MRTILILFLAWLPYIIAQNDFPGDECIDAALQNATKAVENAIKKSYSMLKESKKANPELLFTKEHIASPKAEELAKAEIIVELTLRFILEKFNPSGNLTRTLSELVSDNGFKRLASLAGCVRERADIDCSDWCFHSKYHNIDGSCNNLANPEWGASLTPFNRLLPALYEDGLNIPRGFTPGMLFNGFPLPSARLISSQLIAAPHIRVDCKYTNMLMTWGQFLDHDMSFAPLGPSLVGFVSGFPCRESCKNEMPCFPIYIPACDPRIKTAECLAFTRSSPMCGSGHTFTQREQINELTAYIDASNVYGSSLDIHESVRDQVDRKFLKKGIKLSNNKFLLPVDEEGNFAECEIDHDRSDTPCFLAGDRRANENLLLTVMHTIWFREHNRIAEALAQINTHWSDETIFQETRKIIVAQMQRITYIEWLPKILGMKGIEKLGPYLGYDPNVDAGIIHSFATAAFRMGHTFINPTVRRLDKNFQEIPDGNLPLHQFFFAPHRLVEEGGVDPLLRGMFSDGSKQPDPKKIFTSEVTDNLFKLAFDIALDLASLNIQRGRDHGIPTYKQMRDICGLRHANTFKDLQGEISKRKLLKNLKGLYGDVRNIDLFVGSVSEDILQGARVGPTFLCMLVEQFRRLRDGDRFFYENPGVFNSDQLKEIRKASLSRVICNNGDDIEQVQPDAFRRTTQKYSFENCQDFRRIPAIDLNAWRDDGCPGYPPVAGHAQAFSSEYQVCCCGNVFGTSKDPVSLSKYRCCGKQLYNPDTDSCCERTLYCGRPSSTHRCCGTLVYNPANEECKNGFVIKASKTRRCGSTSFYTLTQICCGGKVFERKRGTTCCGSDAYNPFNEICCNGSVRKTHGFFTRCCGSVTYEADKEVCCPNAEAPASAVLPRPRGVSNKDKHGNQMDQCASINDKSFINYIYLQDGCCCGQILLGRPLLKDETCCGNQPYNVWTEMCCENAVVTGNPKVMRCCGKFTYNPAKQSCCQTESGPTLAECGACPVSGVGVCKGIDYNIDEELCCNGTVHPGGPNIGCCGDGTFNSLTTSCCLSGSCKVFMPIIIDVNNKGICNHRDE